MGDGPFVVTKAAKAVGLDGLRLHPGSARFELMAYMLASPDKLLTREEIADLIGDQTQQTLSSLLKYGYLAAVA